jgi:eukaryotic-like serine/threonine-protein kinase
MTETNLCPDPQRLRSLVDGALPPEEQATLTHHLDECEACRQRLDELAGETDPWVAAARELGEEPPVPGTVLREGLAALDDEPGSQPGAEGDAALDFLAPPENPEHVGRLGPYEVLEVVGRGGMGVVLKALDLALNRLVAIKVLAPQLATNAAARRRFAREAQAAAAVSHDHVVAIHAVEETNGLPHLVMQYVSGITLQERLERDGPPELREILRIGMQIASGLSAAHAQGLIHRDIKPANILLENGVQRVKITDFGLARAVDDVTLTQHGVLAGTPEYMAPEQARGEPLDHRTDLFSLGSVLYALCTGRPPFRGETTGSVLRRVEEETPRPIPAINPDIPEPLVTVIGTLLAKQPAERFQSAAEVADLLCQYLAHVHQPALVPLPPRLRKPAPPSRWRPGRWALAAGLLLALAGGLGVTEATGRTELGKYLATVLRIPTPDGTLVIEVEDPQVKVKVDDKDIVITGAGVEEIRLRPGPHRLKAERAGSAVLEEIIAIEQKGRRIVKIGRESPGGAGAKLPPVTDARLKAAGDLAEQLRTFLARRGKLQEEVAEADRNLQAGRLAALERQAAELNAQIDRARQSLNEALAPLRVGELLAKKDASKPLAPAEAFLLGELLGTTRPVAKTPDVDPNGAEAKGGTVWSLAFSPDGKSLAAAGKGTMEKSGALTVWDFTRRRSRFTSSADREYLAVAYSPDGKLLAACEDGGAVRLLDAATGAVRASALETDARALAFSPDGRRLATAGVGGRIRIWDPNRQGPGLIKEVRSFAVPGAEVSALAFSPDGRQLLSGGSDRVVRAWDVMTGKILGHMTDCYPLVHCLAFAPDGKRLATAQGGRSVILWDAATYKQVAALAGHAGTIRCLAFAPDGRRLASAGDGEVRFWDVESGRLIRTIQVNEDRLVVLAVSPDGNWLAAAGSAGKIHVWNLAQLLEQVTKLQGQPTDSRRFGPWIESFELKPDPRSARQQRWRLLFDTRNPEDYLAQLQALRATLAFPQKDGDQYLVVRDLMLRPVAALREDLAKTAQLFWVDDNARSVEGLVKALGLGGPTPAYVVAMFDDKLERRLRELERQRYAGAEENIEDATFRLVRRDGGFELQVVDVRLKHRAEGPLRLKLQVADGKVTAVLDGETVGLEKLAEALRRRAGRQKASDLVLEVNKDVTYAEVVKALNAVKAAGVTRPLMQVSDP